jgi:hypothetical protein
MGGEGDVASRRPTWTFQGVAPEDGVGLATYGVEVDAQGRERVAVETVGPQLGEGPGEEPGGVHAGVLEGTAHRTLALEKGDEHVPGVHGA